MHQCETKGATEKKAKKMATSEQTQEKINLLNTWISECKPHRMVFFGGAGVSTESGIPDFRSPDGLYAQKYKLPPEQIISSGFFHTNPKTFFEYYCDKMIALDAKPNTAHIRLAQLEEQGTLRAVVTQNIDGLHQAAGSKNVLELHGSMHRNFCMKCNRFFDVHEMLAARDEDSIPRCACGGIIKPDVVLYDESLDMNVLTASVQAIQNADLMVVAGTSLAVYPAAGLIDYFRGDHLAIVNLSPTPADTHADLCIAAKIGEALGTGAADA